MIPAVVVVIGGLLLAAPASSFSAAAWMLGPPASPSGRSRILVRRAVAAGTAEEKKEQREPQPWEDDYPRPPIKVYDDDFSDKDIQAFYEETISGEGGPPPAGPVEDIITQYFTWDGRPRNGVYSKEDSQVAFDTMKGQMRDQTWITYGGPKQKTPDDKRGWVWLVGEMTVVGLCLQIYKSIPYGRRPLLVAKADDVDSMFEKVNWSKFEERLERDFGTLLREEPRPPDSDDWRVKFGYTPEE